MAMLTDNILITGATGFIGQHLLSLLHGQGIAAHCIVHHGGNGKRSIPEAGKVYLGNLQDKGFVQNCIDDCKPQYVFHLAASKNRSDHIAAYYDTIETNLIGSLNLFNAVRQTKELQAVVIMGTVDEYGSVETPFLEGTNEKPSNAYGLSKLCVSKLAEVLYMTEQFPCIMLRPTVAYGPGQGAEMFLSSMIKSLACDEEFKMTLGEQERDFIYISDVVDAIVKAALTPEAIGETINVGSGVSVSLASIALQVESLMGKQGLIRLGEVAYRKTEPMHYAVKINKAKELLGWEPKISLEQGLMRMIEFVQKRMKC